MKKRLVAGLLALVVLAAGVYCAVFCSPFGQWQKTDEKGNFDIFSSDINYRKVQTGEEDNQVVRVIYDDQRVGMFCSEIDDGGDVMACVPFVMGKDSFEENDKLSEVMDVPLLGGAMATKIEIKNGLFSQKMRISVYPLSAPCAKDKSCEWKYMTVYKRGL